MLQLKPQIPVEVVAHQNWKGPVGKATAIGWIDESAEHHLAWIVFMDDSRECWTVPNPYIRARKNITAGRA